SWKDLAACGSKTDLSSNPHLGQDKRVIKGCLFQAVVAARGAAMSSGVQVRLKDQNVVIGAEGAHLGYVLRRLPVHPLAEVERCLHQHVGISLGFDIVVG